MEDLADRLLALEAEEWRLTRRAALCECHKRLTPLGNIFFTILISYGYSGFGVIAHMALEWWRPASPSASSSPPCLFPPLCWADARSAGSTGTGTVTGTPADNLILAYAVRDIIASWYIFIFSTTAVRRPLVYAFLFAGCRRFFWEG
ncbi:hypothetical protein BJY01DRAFT_251968 [Aspergillus pseudoustus]|uniref:Uncharacterized protein n=1 Tax=Aspergillus pseudoustus TaxID=1810923 RepID=A0ABR4J9F6_9EURO